MKLEARIRKLEGRQRTGGPRLCIFTTVSPSPNGPVNEGPKVAWVLDPLSRERRTIYREAEEDPAAFLKRVRADFNRARAESLKRCKRPARS